MTHQMHVIYSDFFEGAGIMAGGPFGCASMHGYDTMSAQCAYPETSGDGISVDLLIKNAKDLESQGLISNLENLKSTKIWVESTTLDKMVSPNIVDKTFDFYHKLGNISNTTYQNSTVSPHAF